MSVAVVDTANLSKWAKAVPNFKVKVHTGALWSRCGSWLGHAAVKLCMLG